MVNKDHLMLIKKFMIYYECKGGCILRKYYLIGLGILLLGFANVTLGISSDTKTIPISRLLHVQVYLPDQKQSLIVPTDPLNFDTTLEWEVDIAKKGLASEKEAAFFTIEDLGKPANLLERKNVSGSGKIIIPKGKQFKVTLNAGEYSLLVTKEGATVQAKLKYTEAQIRYSLGDKPYQCNLEVLGPAGLTDWSWLWSNSDNTAGNKVSHQFGRDGKLPVIVEGKGKTASGVTAQKFYFDLDVPPLIEMNPMVEPLKGPVELNVAAKVNAVINYGQRASYTWDFGNGVELSGPEVGNNIVKPGKHQIVLTAKVGDYTFQRNWLVEAEPMTISANPVVTPLSGPVPLDISGMVNPVIKGGPAQLKFRWQIGQDAVDGNELKYHITEPGDYQLVLQTVDKLHPALVVPETVFLVKALPPQLDIKPTASIMRGIIPLSVYFEPHLTVTGSPVDLSYRWDFGDGDTGNLETPNHIYQKPGIYNAQLTVNDRNHQGNLVSALVKVEVLPPELRVTVRPSVNGGFAPLTVNFNAQVGVTGSPCEPQFFWDFGDGETSLEQNPVHL
ncbi:MAG TPA: hypothetical protein DDW65_16280, partial [Firmicutes bacterium]|nr:hypothetical protein [Bacillota bacterium]